MSTKLFVGSLPTEASEEDLQHVFGTYGKVEEVHLLKPGGRSGQRAAFVVMSTAEDAQTAINTLDGVYKLRPQDPAPMVVRIAFQAAPHMPGPVAPSAKRHAPLFQSPESATGTTTASVPGLALPAPGQAIPGIPAGYDPSTFAQLLAAGDPSAIAAAAAHAAQTAVAYQAGQGVASQPPGTVVVSTVGGQAQYNPAAGSVGPRRPAAPFVARPDQPYQHKSFVLDQTNGALLQQPSSKLFVGGLPPLITEDLLRSVFAPYGEIDEVVIIKSKSTSGAGCGFVRYAAVESATNAIKLLDGQYQILADMPPIAVRYSGKRDRS